MSDNTTRPYDPAAPSSPSMHDYAGLTKREEFAKAAMIGLLAANWEASNEDVAAAAAEQADALIAALNKTPHE